MKLKEYIKESARTDAPGIHLDKVSPQTLHGIMGVSSEAGELEQLVRKSLFYGHDFPEDKARSEVGDIFWYMMQICRSMGWNPEDIFQENIDKLRARYPEQFTPELALEQRDKSYNKSGGE